jgi:putative oxidoreductase
MMEWERLIRFGLLGDANMEPWAILLVRVALGVFFAISGGNKLFVASRTKAMCDTFVVSCGFVRVWFRGHVVSWTVVS